MSLNKPRNEKVTPRGKEEVTFSFSESFQVWEECLARSPEVAVTTHPSGLLGVGGGPWLFLASNPLGF